MAGWLGIGTSNIRERKSYAESHTEFLGWKRPLRSQSPTHAIIAKQTPNVLC